ncbi:MAG TPA: tripartite tricarboxylate transporter substrate binding protein [Advenella kashmirensis]|uniref:Tripartite tricarboxylate transporter substrate binding protein n=2 Tax=Advenella TaxID=290425 RepID=A0A356LEF3_9BURK|nr:tripartite tricarboxylate transporter substrate binding protein [Advenella sp. FME57]HBP29390.1 tripartite tricarboxylate transporter substrate binding protein [Advenella kashmirensis]
MVTSSAQADTYPDRPIRMLLPFSAGGGGDILGRIIAEQFAAQLGKPVVVENKPGAGGTIGIADVARAKPDGYTITIGGMTTHVLSPHVYTKIAYDPVKDFTSLGVIGSSSIVMIANSDFPASNLAGVKSLNDSSKEPLQYASWGRGSTGHFCGEVLAQKMGIKLAHVPYKGTAQLANDILGGHISVGFVDMVTATPYVQGGKVKALAVCTQRSPSLPDVASYKEQGVDFDRELNWAMYVPAGTPAPIVDKLSKTLEQTLAQPAIQKKLLGLGITAKYVSGENHTKAMVADAKVWEDIAKQAGIEAQ